MIFYVLPFGIGHLMVNLFVHSRRVSRFVEWVGLFNGGGVNVFCCRVTQDWNSGGAKNWRQIWLNRGPTLADFGHSCLVNFWRSNGKNRCPINAAA